MSQTQSKRDYVRGCLQNGQIHFQIIHLIRSYNTEDIEKFNNFSTKS